MSTRQRVGLAAAACVACCITPIVGAITALGLASSLLIGAAGLLVAAASLSAFAARRRRRTTACSVDVGPVPVELGRRSRR